MAMASNHKAIFYQNSVVLPFVYVALTSRDEYVS